jgi:DNA-binding transcriptional MerR regulator/methylmalonyl-CoA mutase cobalamin-binding subunit
MPHSISAVARIANLSPDVIRSWERRYKIVEPERDASGVRRYSDKDVARLTLAREATRLGHAIRHVAQLSDGQLQELIDRKPAETGSTNDVVARLIEAMHANDLGTASHVLRSAALLVPARELVLDVFAPALREVGRQWESGDLAVWQEHFLSNQLLGVAAPLQQLAPGEPRIVLATPPFERHGFGIGLAALLAVANGVAPCNLGVTVPASELIAATRRLRVPVVVIGMTQESLHESDGIAYAREVRAGLPRSVEVLLGGAFGARVAAAAGLPGVRGVETLEAFDALCRQWT